MNAAHGRAEDDADVMGVLFGDLKLGVLDGELGCDKREKGGAV